MNCLLCAGKTNLYFDYGKQTGVLQRLVRCVDCGLVQTDPMPAESFLREWYQRYDVLGEREPYYQALAGVDPWNTPEGFEIARQFAWVKRALTATRHPELVKTNGKSGVRDLSVLDVGSGPGLFLDLVKRAGWQGIGIELNAEAAIRSHERFGIDARPGTIDSVELPEHSFDVVTLWDIFEHVRNPLGMLHRAHELLKPGGYLFLETPNVRSLLDWAVILLARIGVKGPAATFYGLHHLTLWDPKTIRRVFAERGFTIKDIRFMHTPGSRVFRGQTPRDTVMRAGIWIVQVLGVLLKRQNKMVIVARKT